ncbi:MAG: Gx transporter family protein [Clostridia bacterium]|nr:Gx transporter family protein [Clostridia bacterium]
MRTSSSRKDPARRVAELGILLVLAMVFSYLEALFPIPLPLPGIKLGFANIAVILCACYCGLPEALLLNLLRVVLSAILFGNLSGLLFSLSGAFFSSLTLIFLVLSFRGSVSVLGISVACAASHNLGQILCASFLLRGSSWINPSVFSYIPVLLLASLITGTITGILLKLLFAYLEKTGKELRYSLL